MLDANQRQQVLSEIEATGVASGKTLMLLLRYADWLEQEMGELDLALRALLDWQGESYVYVEELESKDGWHIYQAADKGVGVIPVDKQKNRRPSPVATDDFRRAFINHIGKQGWLVKQYAKPGSHVLVSPDRSSEITMPPFETSEEVIEWAIEQRIIATPTERPPTPIFAAIAAERKRQDIKFGEQNHEVGKWLLILTEELGEISKSWLEEDRDNYMTELVQTAAVLVAWIEYEHRRQSVLNTLDDIKTKVHANADS